MFRALFAKEILEAVASRRFWAILVLCLVLVPLGVEVSLKDYQTRLQNYREAARIYQEETKTVGDVLYKEGAKAFAPPAPLSFLSLGLELVLPKVAESQYKVGEGAASLRLSNNQGRDNLYEYFYGPLDLVFVVGVIMSFLAIVLTYGAVAGEKEQGTLRQMLANSVPRATVILAKGRPISWSWPCPSFWPSRPAWSSSRASRGSSRPRRERGHRCSSRSSSRSSSSAPSSTSASSSPP